MGEACPQANSCPVIVWPTRGEEGSSQVPVVSLYQDIIEGSSGRGRGAHQTQWMLRLRGWPTGTLSEGRGRNGAG